MIDVVFAPIRIESRNYLSYMSPYLEQIIDNDVSQNTQKLLGVLPYAFLKHLSMTFASSWLVHIEKLGEMTIQRHLRSDLPSETISPADICINEINGIDVKKTLDKYREFKLPKNTKIEIKIDTEQSSLILKNPLFTVTLCSNPSIYSLGLPSIIEQHLQQHYIEDNFATYIFTMNFDSHFAFPDSEDPLFEEHYKFAEIINQIIQEKWNWDLEMEKLKDSRIDTINRTMVEILALMKKFNQ